MSKSLWDKYKKEDKQEQTNSSGKANTTTAGTPTTTTTTATAPAANSIISPYAAQRDKLYSEYMGRKPFSYDYTNDPVYKAYEQSYTNKGKLAMEDTIAQSAALTGGYGNTYGHVAGQQVYDDYMQGLSDIIPDLYNDAYSKYKAEGDTLYNQYALAADRADADQERAAAELAAILAAGGTPSDELIARSGYSSEYINAMKNYYSNLSSGSGTGSTYSDDAATAAQAAEQYAALTGIGTAAAILSGRGGESSNYANGISADDSVELLKSLRGGVVDVNGNVIGLSDYGAAVQELYDEGLLSAKDYYAMLASKNNKGNSRVLEVK